MKMENWCIINWNRHSDSKIHCLTKQKQQQQHAKVKKHKKNKQKNLICPSDIGSAKLAALRRYLSSIKEKKLVLNKKKHTEFNGYTMICI